MSLDSNIIVDIFDSIVDSMRATGTITSISVTSGISTIQSVNTLSVNEVVLIGATDYAVISRTASQFTVEGTGITATTWTSRQPYYEYGHPVEIADKLIAKDGQVAPYSYKKYPLIVLFTDVKLNVGNPKLQGIVNDLMMVIINRSDINYSSKDRYTNNIKTILYPLYETLIKKMQSSSYFIGVTPNLKHTLIERPFWGSVSKYGNIKNMFTDPLDALELSKIELKIRNKNTC